MSAQRMAPIGTGFIGFGRLGQLRNMTFSRSGHYRTLGYVDPNLEGALVDRTVFPSVDALLKTPGLEAVVVSVPSALSSDMSTYVFPKVLLCSPKSPQQFRWSGLKKRSASFPLATGRN